MYFKICFNKILIFSNKKKVFSVIFLSSFCSVVRPERRRHETTRASPRPSRGWRYLGGNHGNRGPVIYHNQKVDCSGRRGGRKCLQKAAIWQADPNRCRSGSHRELHPEAPNRPFQIGSPSTKRVRQSQRFCEVMRH